MTIPASSSGGGPKEDHRPSPTPPEPTSASSPTTAPASRDATTAPAVRCPSPAGRRTSTRPASRPASTGTRNTVSESAVGPAFSGAAAKSGSAGISVGVEPSGENVAGPTSKPTPLAYPTAAITAFGT